MSEEYLNYNYKMPVNKDKQETVEEAAEKYWTKQPYNQDAFEEGAKWMAERMYSEEEVIAIVEKSRITGLTADYLLLTEQFKKK
jgi:hypothetical protein